MKMHSRRSFVKRAAILAGLIGLQRDAYCLVEGKIMTVSGMVEPSDLGFTLSHEHIMVDFIGASEVGPDRYNQDEVFDVALPFLKKLKDAGFRSFIDCTPAYLGRDVKLLQRLSKASGLNIISATGYYGAVKEKYIPKHAYNETPEQLAARWTSEWEHGIDGTEIKPGFIKTGVDEAPLTDTQKKLIDAAALTHLATGLTIGVHTGNGLAADAQLEILARRGVAPAARIWIHSQNEKDKTYHVRSAQRGSWVSFDGVNPESIDRHIDYLMTMKSEGLLKSVLVSQDAGWYHVGEKNGGKFNPYTFVATDFFPALKRKGFTQHDIETIFITNPAKAFAIKVRTI